jgi:hypothetical protein
MPLTTLLLTLRNLFKFADTIVYLPLIPEFNSIEQFCSVCKSNIKREKFLEQDTPTSRIADNCNNVLIDDCQGFCGYQLQDLTLFAKSPSLNSVPNKTCQKICQINFTLLCQFISKCVATLNLERLPNWNFCAKVYLGCVPNV